jgi:excinuclease ABC subunit B
LETNRRRVKQDTYNKEHGIEPQQIVKAIRDLTDRVKALTGSDEEATATEAQEASVHALDKDQIFRMIKELENEMKKAAQSLEFEKAAALRDQIFQLRGVAADKVDVKKDESLLVN